MNVTQTSNGHLECRDCGLGTNWCEHIREFCEEGHDADLIWIERTDVRTGEIKTEPVTPKIEVPYVPTQSQWARVLIDDENLGNWKLYFVGHGDETRDFIGFVSPGEGRSVMRGMVHAWFWPKIDPKAECKSSSHSFSAQQAWERDLKEGATASRHLAQRFSVHTTGMCLVCAGTSVNGDDLVPDVSSPRRWR